MLSPQGKRSSKLRKFVVKFKSAYIRQPISELLDDKY